MPGWLRWLLILPAAIASFAIMRIFLTVIHGITPNGADVFMELARFASGPWAFVVAGAAMAPRAGRAVAVVLAGIICVFAVAFLILYLSAGAVGRAGAWPLVEPIVAIGGAILGVVHLRQGVNGQKTQGAAKPDLDAVKDTDGGRDSIETGTDEERARLYRIVAIADDIRMEHAISIQDAAGYVRDYLQRHPSMGDDRAELIREVLKERGHICTAACLEPKEIE
jgi:hypothetical protein